QRTIIGDLRWPYRGRAAKVRGTTSCTVAALTDADARSSRNIPKQRIGRVDSHGATFASRELRPRRCRRSGRSGSRPVRTQTHEQRAGIRRMLRKADHLCKRSKLAIEILKMSRVISRAGNCLLVDPIRRPPETTIVAKINKRLR